MNITSLKIGTRLAIGFGVVMLLMAIIATIGVIRLTDEYNTADETINGIYPRTSKAERIAFVSMDNARLVRNLILVKDAAQIETYKAALAKNRVELKELIADLEQHIPSKTGQELLRDIKETRQPYVAMTDEVIDQALKNNEQEAIATLYGPKHATQDAYIKSIRNFVEFEEQKMKDGGVQAKIAYNSALTLMIAIAVAAVSIGSLMAWTIARSLIKQLGGEPHDAATIASRIADGDLTVEVVTRSGDNSSVMYAMKTMRNNLVRIVSDVRSGTDTIATASGEIASGNLDLSSRTEQQASSLEETASSMEELTSTVKQNADNARQANRLAMSASDVAVRGGEVVSEVVDTMNGINESAKKIVDIIGVIDGIAFQTNILALNAAVEAARAGEQGRGFAVVATEVRNLAQRSAAAAKEIKALIGDSVGKVDAGSKLVEQAGATMNEVVTSVKRVSDIISEIAAASAEQEAGISQINIAITEMDNVTQKNAALVEEAAAAAGSMQDQAEHLVGLVKVFKVDAARNSGIALHNPAGQASPNHSAPPRKLSVVHSASAARTVAGHLQLKTANGGDWEEF